MSSNSSALAWVKALRLVYYPTTFLVLLVGISVSVHAGILHRELIFWMVLGNVLLHCACSLINEYSDFVTGADLVDYPELKWKTATGGSRVLVDQLINPNHVFYVSFLFFFSSFVIWMGLAFTDCVLGGVLALSLGVTFLYSAAFSKGRFYYLREVLLTFLAVPLFVLSVVKILSGEYLITAFVAGLYTGVHMMNYLLYHGLIDLEADLQSGKLRVTRVLGVERTLLGSEGLIVGSFIILVVFLYLRVLPGGCVLPFGLVPLAVKIVWAERKRVLVGNYTAVVLFFVLSVLLLAVGFWP